MNGASLSGRGNNRTLGPSDSGSEGGTGERTFSVDSIAQEGVTTLIGIDARTLEQEQLIYVKTVGDYYRVAFGENITADGRDVVNSSIAGYQFVRLFIANERFLTQTFWAVDPANSSGVASDENNGYGVDAASARANPLRTMTELNNRRSGDSVGILTTIQVELMSSQPVGANPIVLSNWKTGNGNGYPIMVGTKTKIFPAGSSATVTAYTTHNPAGNTGFLLTAVGLGAGAAVGKLIETLDGTKAGWISASLGANQYRVSQPNTSDVVNANAGTGTNFAVNDQVVVYDIPVMPVWPWRDDVVFCGAGWLDFSSFVSNFTTAQLGETQPFICRCRFGTNASWYGGLLAIVSGCRWEATLSFYDGFWASYFLSIAGRVDLLQHNLQIDANTITLESGQLVLSRESRIDMTSSANLAAFTCTTGSGIVAGSSSSQFNQQSGFVYGTGNTIPTLQQSNCRFVVNKGGLVLVTSGQQIVSDGSNYSYTDVSINTSELGATGVFDVTVPTFIGALKFSGTLLTSVIGAVTSFVADAGSLLSVANLTTPQRYPTSKRLVKRLRVTKTLTPAGSTSNVVVTVMKNNVATAMTITILAADAVGTKYADVTHAVAYSDADDLDLRATTAGAEGGVAGLVGFSALLES